MIDAIFTDQMLTGMYVERRKKIAMKDTINLDQQKFFEQSTKCVDTSGAGFSLFTYIN